MLSSIALVIELAMNKVKINLVLIFGRAVLNQGNMQNTAWSTGRPACPTHVTSGSVDSEVWGAESVGYYACRGAGSAGPV